MSEGTCTASVASACSRMMNTVCASVCAKRDERVGGAFNSGRTVCDREQIAAKQGAFKAGQGTRVDRARDSDCDRNLSQGEENNQISMDAVTSILTNVMLVHPRLSCICVSPIVPSKLHWPFGCPRAPQSCGDITLRIISSFIRQVISHMICVPHSPIAATIIPRPRKHYICAKEWEFVLAYRRDSQAQYRCF